jgi:hypothetical protein
MNKIYADLAKEYGVVTQEVWSNPNFRAIMYSKILDTGLSVLRDKTPPACSEDRHTVERKPQF